MSDVSKDAVKLYRPAVHTDGAACMVDCKIGFWVSKPDYDALAAKLAEVEAERDTANFERAVNIAMLNEDGEAMEQAAEKITTLKAERDAARAALVTALAHLDSSLFTNAEHQRAKDTLRAAIAQEKADE